MRETIGTGSTAKVLDFIYDNQGRPQALRYSTNGGGSFTTYYYVLNLQGDVIKLVKVYPGIATDVAAEYSYDAWGNVISATGSMADINPLRYRGYYYDAETGFYYLQSRYYDPALHRFINADSYASTGASFLGTNMFAYCGNNPVRRSDAMGTDWIDDLCSGLESAWNWTANTASDVLDWSGEAISSASTWVVKFGTAVWKGLDISAGVGQGLYVDVSCCDLLGLSIGGYGNYANVYLDDGAFAFGMEAGLEAVLDLPLVDFGAGTYAYTSIGEKPRYESFTLLNENQDSLTIFSASAYLIWGFSFRLGFDVNTFCKEMEK